MTDPRQTPAPAPTRIGATPAGTEYHAYAARGAAAAAARWAPGGLALRTLRLGPTHPVAPCGWVAAWVGVEGADESPLCAGPTEADAVAALFGEGDDAFA